jgi:di/tripeptidase
MEVNRRDIPKVRKTQHQNPEFGHTGGEMDQKKGKENLHVKTFHPSSFRVA